YHVSIFGEVIGVNRDVDAVIAKQMHEIFLEIVLAHAHTKEALDILTQKKNIRLLEIDGLDQHQQMKKLTSVKGGVLVQTSDEGSITKDELEVVTEKAPTDAEWEDLLFSWKVDRKSVE